MIGLKDSRHFVIVALSRRFSRPLRTSSASSFDWFTGSSVFFMIGWSDNCTLLWVFYRTFALLNSNMSNLQLNGLLKSRAIVFATAPILVFSRQQNRQLQKLLFFIISIFEILRCLDLYTKIQIRKSSCDTQL